MYAKYAKIRDSLGYTDYAVAKACGFRQSTLSDWRNGKYQIKHDKLQKIAALFNVDVETFASDDASEVSDTLVTKKELEIIQAFRAASEDTQKNIQLILGVK